MNKIFQCRRDLNSSKRICVFQERGSVSQPSETHTPATFTMSSPVTQITFVVNTPIWKSFTFEEFKLSHLEEGTSEEKAQQIWDSLVKKAKKVEGKFAEFIEESMTGIDVVSDCLEDAETEINDLIEEKLEEVKEELEEELEEGEVKED